MLTARYRLDKTEADFETLRDYNDYLETVEEITWNLILKIDLEETEKKLRQYEEAQKAEKNIATRSYQPDPSLPTDTAKVVLKKAGGQRKTAANNKPDTNGISGGGLNFHGLKKYVAPEPEKPLDPYGGWSVEPQYYVLQDKYDVAWLNEAAERIPDLLTGGYDMRDYYSQALCDAFSGFGVFIEDEKNQVSGEATVGTQTAAAAAVGGKDLAMDDVF